MRRSIVRSAIAAAAATLSVAGCSDTPTVTDPNTIVFPDSLVSYRAHVDPFLTLRCGGPCHAAPDPVGGIDLTVYQNLFFDRPNLVVAGLPDESLLCQVLERLIGHPAGNLETIPSNQVTGIRTWVREGALNN